MQCRKGPNAVRTGHTATFASLDLRKAGAKTQDLGPRRSSDRAGAWHLCKNSKSAIKLLQMVLATPHYSPNAKTPRFGIRNHPKHTTHELQHTAGTTSPSVTPGSSLASCGKSPAARRNQNGPTTPLKRRSAAGTALGTQLVVT